MLGFGTAPIGLSNYQLPGYDQRANERLSLDAVAAAIDRGINFFDTAPAYANKVPTNGWSTDRASERMLGLALEGRPRDRLFIATKNMFDRMDAPGIRASLEESLRLLKTDYVDLFRVHGIIAKPFRADNWREFVNDDVLATFEALKDEGKIRFIGISGYREEALCAAIESGHFQVVMPQFNYFHRNAELELVHLAKRRGVAVAPMRPLTGGLMKALIEEIDPEGTLTADPYRVAMQYILGFDSVATIPVGMRTVAEVEHNVQLVCELEGRRRAA
ncbi:aldo/keto reductase [Blastococcus sp. CCUG 61487]|uniref:aldo/keto reductase n=1 Tax=Blastococcus sp. CCUG 61487 TaxID=1840703 RepID=UPI001134C9CC|nr:aldo/keto reductase [Blastococcus sp. CCUG 61487]TKJ18873.1 hypothetical protein A6V29_10840 [Blastococcus sp. CCUG 61487]